MKCPLCDKEATTVSRQPFTEAQHRGGGTVCFDPDRGIVAFHEDDLSAGKS